MDHGQQSDFPESLPITKPKDDKLPHDASVFVGSLPSNIDQGDLSRMLTEHLSEHTQIKNIKVVRDSKGGVCAFVQCEDAPSATALIETLHSSPPKPFMGRILRYEPARAFRTLLISYRTPTQSFRSPGFIPSQQPSLGNENVELALPHAMRIWKHRNSRFHSILYNIEAIQAHDSACHVETSPAGHENVFFVDPINYDDEALRSLAQFFGPLESFRTFNPDDVDGERVSLDSGQYPPPHNAPRSASMDTRCWEVKWEHRDDCVSALMTLRRIPHLTATWAHQPSIAPNQRFQPYARNIGGSPYAMHVQPRTPHSYTFVAPPNLFVPQFMQSPQPFPSMARGQHQRGLSHPYFGRALAERLPHQSCGRAVHLEQRHVVKVFEQEGSSLPPTSAMEKDIRTADPEEPSSPDPDSQELFMPQTPALDSSSITPVTPGSQFPVTPTTGNTSHDGFGLKDEGMSFTSINDREVDPTTLFVGGLEMSGPGAWDEERVKSFFSRFGGLESVKVVRPTNAAAAFAFVKFNNPESPARAVFEEHNRVYDGRAMRVQLRDVNPPRNNWKFNRGRGRFPHQQFNPHRRLHNQPFLNIEEKIPHGAANFRGPDVEDGINMSSLASALPIAEDNIQSDASDIPAETPVGEANNASDPPRYREWYDDLQSPAPTPEPSSLGSSASATGPPYTVPSYQYPPVGGYYPPTPWMAPYMPPGPYPMPFYPGYPAYHHPPPHLQQPPSHGSASSSDASSSTPMAPPVWPTIGAYGSFIPYPVMPSRPPVAGQGPQTPTVAQAPVVPAGFIHNEQGMIAVYQPEALNHYMSVSGPNATSTPTMNGDSSQRSGPQTPSLARIHEQGNVVPATSPHPQPSRGQPVSPAVHDQRYSGPQRPSLPFRHHEGNMMNGGALNGHRRLQNRPLPQNFHHGRNGTYGNSSSRGFHGRSGRAFLTNVPSAGRAAAYDWA